MALLSSEQHSARLSTPDELIRAKQLSREKDAFALASGEKTQEQLRTENAFVRVSYDELVICRPGSLR